MQAHLDKMQVPVNWLIQSLKQKGSALVIAGILSLLSPLKKVLDDTKIYIINIIKHLFLKDRRQISLLILKRVCAH